MKTKITRNRGNYYQRIEKYHSFLVELHELTSGGWAHIDLQGVFTKFNIGKGNTPSLIECGIMKRRRIKGSPGNSYEYIWIGGRPTKQMAVAFMNYCKERNIKKNIERKEKSNETVIKTRQFTIDEVGTTDNVKKRKKSDSKVTVKSEKTYISIFWGLIKIQKG